LAVAGALSGIQVIADDPPPRSLPSASITLQGKFTLKHALAAVQQQTGNAIVDLRERLGQEAPDPELSVNLTGVSFWPALDELSRQANVALQPHIDAQTKRAAAGIVGPDLVTGKSPALPVAYSGPFRAVVRRVAANRDLAMESRSKLVVALELACEPRFQPLLLRVARDSIKATDATGRSAVVEQGGAGTVKLLGECPVELTIQLPLPARTVAELPELACAFVALVHPQRLEFDFPRLATGEKRNEQGLAVALRRVDVDPRQNRTRLSLGVEYPRGSLDLESHQTWAAESHEALLQNKAVPGHELQAIAREISVEEGGPMRISYTFPEAPANLANWSLRYRLPAAPIRVPLEFRFTKLPLP
jgi:hypothetical protein